MRKATACTKLYHKLYSRKTYIYGKRSLKENENYLFVGIFLFLFTYFRICLRKIVFSLAHVFLFF